AMDNDVAVVAAAGNDGCNCMVYPANYPEVVAVGALNPSGNRASFSSYGSNLDIIAPGQEMITPVWIKTNQTSAYAGDVAGTSFSTPFVAGVLGLMRAHQPDASWDEIIGIMAENSDRKSLTSAQPHSSTIGFGSVMASTALERASQPFSPFTSYRFDGTILGSEKIKKCDPGVIPGSFLYELSKNGRINYTINQYEKRQKISSGWSSKKLFGLCVGLPTDTPDFIRLLNLTAEIRNKILKQ
ncbi:MAG TPA: S8 family serine peptidase, partial [Candidatus Saccharimonadales bacterium]|nr:S8 family serine peptidase [Candidatus Saccharimonadales bacterium]